MNLIDKIKYWGLHFFVFFFGKMSLKTGAALGKLLGTLWFYLDKKHRKITIDNLSYAYGQKMSKQEILVLAKKTFINTSRMIFEYTWFYNSKNKHFSEQFIVKGINHLRSAHAKKKGILILSAHIGNWEFGAAFPHLTGFPITVVYRKIKSKPIDMVVKKNRTSIDGVELLPLHNALDDVIQTLKKGGLVALLVDQNTGHRRGVFIDFFGQKACANPGLTKLALQTRSPVIPVFNYREKGKFVVEIQPELQIIKTGDMENDIIKNTQLQNNIIEKIIRKHPDQWFWMHNRWKTRPLNKQ